MTTPSAAGRTGRSPPIEGFAKRGCLVAAQEQYPLGMRVAGLQSGWSNVAIVVAVSAIDGYANARQQRWADWPALGLFACYAGYCIQNFVRCREVHCAVTAPGFLTAAALMLLRITGSTHYEYGFPWIVFVASACVGYCVQWVYKSRTGSIFLKR